MMPTTRNAVAIGNQKRIALIPFAQIFLARLRPVTLKRQTQHLKHPTHQIGVIMFRIHIRKQIAHCTCERNTPRGSNNAIHAGSFGQANQEFTLIK
jgi:hypothetical protein